MLLIVWNKLGFVWVFGFLGFWVFEISGFSLIIWFWLWIFGEEWEKLTGFQHETFSIGLCFLLKFYCITDLILSGKGSWFNGFNFEFVFLGLIFWVCVLVFFVFLNLSLCLVLGLCFYVFVLMFKFVIMFLFKMN